MSPASGSRRNLPYVDPASFTPQFAWKKARKGSGREVFCEGVTLREIASRYGTPVYVYSERAIEDAFNELDRGLHRVPHLLCFAVKANGNLSILRLLAKRGSGFDIVSGGELEHLSRIGVPGNRIVFSGVGKTREEIRAGLAYKHKGKSDTGILQFNVESAEELEVLLQESSRRRNGRGQLPGVSLRVNPDVKAGGHPHISTGLSQHKFGVSWPDARALYLQHRNSKQIRWQGISAHIGSQIVGLGPFREALNRLAGYLLDLRTEGIVLKYLDFGGGLGVRYTDELPVPRKAYSRMIAEMVRPLAVGLLLEPGRSIIAPAGVLLSNVIYTKKKSSKSFVIVDAAMNDLVRPVLYDAPHPITCIRQSGSKQDHVAGRVDIVGPVCETGDCFLQEWPLGKVQPGDTLAIWTAGAYGMVQSSNYNGRCRPAEVLVNGKRARLIRRRETQTDVLRTDLFAGS
ncbi:MAG TPA: diaminopimelate decarboxylase [Candidatus Acidoferrales bacterium]|jgi:diaminopimelate decarboxylase|nr:diaminopimelate decarboxylase [Candidatus Acidoferrales bacterium]